LLYLSPEAKSARGRTHLDFTKSDVWAMGMNLLHMMSSHHPDDPLTNLSSISFIKGYYSIELQTLVRSMLSIDVTKRPGVIDIHREIGQLCLNYKPCIMCLHDHAT
jgi:serine/threonine protein kinase